VSVLDGITEITGLLIYRLTDSPVIDLLNFPTKKQHTGQGVMSFFCFSALFNATM